jgi:oligoendopeptidase F
VQATENVLNKKTVALGADQIPLPQAQGILSQQSAEKRHALQKELNAAYEATADIAESEINAVFTDKKIEDELRGYKTPYEATVRGYQNDTKTVLALVDAVTKHFSIAHRFYEVKRKLLKLDRLTYEDRSASVGDIKSKIPFERATALVREEFEKLDPHYAQIFDRLLDNSQVDVYPRKGKTGIQYCSASVSLPTMLMLNYTGDFNSVKTLAHEMGHAMHAERAKDQRPMYQGHPTSTAETASTFFERVALKRLVADLPSEERIVALHNALQDDISTVFRQIACFRFEQDLHAEIRRDGYVPKDRIAELMNEHMKAYLGPAFDLKKEDGYFFVAWSHIRTFFYVYSYAYGHLISMALYAKLAKDPSFIKKVDGFLSAGESKSPYDIFKSCGLDTRNPAIFVEGLKAIERDVAELERLIK